MWISNWMPTSVGMTVGGVETNAFGLPESADLPELFL
jgi:hypothetical protein